MELATLVLAEAMNNALKEYPSHDNLAPMQVEINVPCQQGNDLIRKHGLTDKNW
jgi:hypothetical protein